MDKDLTREERDQKKMGSMKKLSSRTIRKKNGDVIRQYPAHVGYHGTDKENRLNPEE